VPNSNGTIVPAGGASGITINMGGVSVSKEADEDRLVQKLTRAIQLQDMGIS